MGLAQANSLHGPAMGKQKVRFGSTAGLCGSESRSHSSFNDMTPVEVARNFKELEPAWWPLELTPQRRPALSV